MDTMAEALLCAASKYQIPLLSSSCESYLCHHVTEDSAISLLKLSDCYSLPKMKVSYHTYSSLSEILYFIQATEIIIIDTVLNYVNILKENILQYIASHTAGVIQTKEFSSLDGDLLKEVTTGIYI